MTSGDLAHGSPNHSHSVASEFRIRRDDRHSFRERLGDQESVKRVGMMERQRCQLEDMWRLDAEEPDAVGSPLVPHDIFQRAAQSELSQRDLDLQLPEVCDAEKQFISRIRYGVTCGGRQTTAIQIEVNQNIRVNEALHAPSLVVREVVERRVEIRCHEIRLSFVKAQNTLSRRQRWRAEKVGSARDGASRRGCQFRLGPFSDRLSALLGGARQFAAQAVFEFNRQCAHGTETSEIARISQPPRPQKPTETP